MKRLTERARASRKSAPIAAKPASKPKKAARAKADTVEDVTGKRPGAAAAPTIERRDGVAYWIVKIEQDVFPWERFVREKRAVWDGVRNYTARNNLRAMKVNDLVLYYHSGESKEIVGIARVSREAFADPTAAEGEDWSAVELEPVIACKKSVTLAQLRARPSLASLMLVRQPRLSVSTLSCAQYDEIVALADTVLKT